MKYIFCKKCGWKRFTMEDLKKCPRCNGKKIVICDRAYVQEEPFDQGGLRERQKKDKEKAEWIKETQFMRDVRGKNTMIITKCNKCGYERLSSLNNEKECRKCGGLVEIIAEEINFVGDLK